MKSEGILRTDVKRERRFVWGFLVVVSATMAHLVRTGWMSTCGEGCFTAGPTPAPLVAPEAYRVLLPALQHGLAHLLHAHDVTLADAIIQFVFCLIALRILYGLTVGRLDAETSRVATVGLFLAFIQLPLAFVVFAQRPETLPTALFVAFALLCLSNGRKGWVWTALLFGATALQAFARTDVPIILGAAVAVLSVGKETLADFGSRAMNLLRGLGVVLIAGSVQLYLQKVRFPHLPYATGGQIVFFDNFHAGHFSVLLLALLPFAGVAWLARSRRDLLTAVDKVALLTIALYLPLWLTIGVIAEVRIGVPLLLALCPMAARVSARFLVEGRA